MAYKIWRSETEIAIEAGDNRIVLSLADAERLGSDLASKVTELPPAAPLTTKQRHAVVAKMWKAGARRRDIAAATGYSPQTISDLRADLGLPPRRGPMPDHVRTALRAGRDRLRSVK